MGVWTAKNSGLSGDALRIWDVWPVQSTFRRGKENLHVWIATKDGVYLSENGCASWTKKSIPDPGVTHDPVCVRVGQTGSNVYVLVVDSTANGYVRDCWLYKSTTMGASWSTLDLTTVDFYTNYGIGGFPAMRMDLNADESYVFIGGADSGGEYACVRVGTNLAGLVKSYQYGIDCLYSVTDVTCDKSTVGAVYIHGFYNLTSEPGVLRHAFVRATADSGGSWTDRTPGSSWEPEANVQTLSANMHTAGSAVAAIQFLAGRVEIWATTDYAVNWALASTPTDTIPCFDGASTLSHDPASPTRLWLSGAGCYQREVARSLTTGASWSLEGGPPTSLVARPAKIGWT